MRRDRCAKRSAGQPNHLGAREVGGGCKLTPRVVEGAVAGLEGDPPQGVIMLEFPLVEDAKASS